MPEYKIALHSLPPQGETFVLDDQAIWTSSIAENAMDCRIIQPLRGEVSLLPQEDGCLVRGHLSGCVLVPCNRCAEDATVVLNSNFDSFEPYPPSGLDEGEDNKEFDSDADEFIIQMVDGAPLLDLTALCWEEFVLALPVRPLCKPDCKGLCPQCGTNLNEKACSCVKEEGDPRFAILRGLTLKN